MHRAQIEFSVNQAVSCVVGRLWCRFFFNTLVWFDLEKVIARVGS